MTQLHITALCVNLLPVALLCILVSALLPRRKQATPKPADEEILTRLGYLAAKCELGASADGLWDWERDSLLRQALTYRDAQLASMEGSSWMR